MSQRGSHPRWVQTFDLRRWRSSIRVYAAITLLLTFGCNLTLTAQAPTPTQNPTVRVTMRVDGTERQVSLAGGTVADLLKQENIILKGHDRVTPVETTPLIDGLVVKVERITFEVLTEKISVAPPVITRWDRRMTVHPVTLRQGKPGVAEQKRCIWKKDGVISEQWTQGRRIVTRPVPTVVVRGNLPSRGVTGRKMMRVVATAYDPGPGSCGKFASGYTAIGLRAGRGVIAVDPRVIPLGSRVYVEGYGPAVAADVGGAIKGNIIDVCFPTRREALQWGRRTVNIVILK